MKTFARNQITVAGAIMALLILFVLCPLPVEGVAGIKPSFQKDRDYFLTNYSNQFQTNSQSAVWLKSFLENLGTSAEVPAQDWLLALRRLVDLAKHEDSFYKSTGFIEDSKVLELLVDGLADSDHDVHNFAVEMLTWQTRERDLLPLASMIKKNLGQMNGDDELLLLGKLSLDKGEKSAALDKSPQLLPMKARLGDSAARQELIGSFNSATNYFEKARLARELGYAGDHESAAALVEGLRSDVSTKSRYEDRSIRVDILLALGQIYQDEALFTRDARLLADNSDSTFDRVRGLKNYVAELNVWSQKNFGHTALDDESVWFIKFSNVPIIRAKP